MVYIDPPYNTGNDFIYEDDFTEKTTDFLKRDSQYDEQGNRLTSNLDSNGRFHTDWINMIYPRLRVARDLLSDDGVLFISIDDNEVQNLKNLCNEIMGESNFIAQIIVASNSSKNNARFISVSHEYILCYAKNKNCIVNDWKVKKNQVDEFERRAKSLLSNNLPYEEIRKELLLLTKYPRFYDFDHYTYIDEKGIYRTDNAGGVKNGNFETEIIHPVTNKPCNKPIGGWRYKEEEIKRMISENMFHFGEDETVIPQPKRYLSDYMYQVPKSILFFDSQSSTKWLKNENIPFQFPKSIDLIKHIISIFDKDALILDFFSGSATTAHAVMQLNAEDNGNRRFIMIQVPEVTETNSEAHNAGYKNICEIGKERIRRAGEKIKEEKGLEAQNLDVGFRVLKLDSSNMKEVYYTPEEYSQMGFNLEGLMDNIKSDRSDEDLLFQVMLDLGIPLSAKIEQDGKIFKVNENYLIACFDRVDTSMITEIAQKQPYYAVFRDSSFVNDSALVNVEQIFNTYSPSTIRRVL